ncbi:MAG TPA: zf-HC2 domain-containing protein [Candidatus Dormibacteraeota bacterium]|nr:zf-HC2 domain-containing protein [Candidatus Dormibacteraeota bacterium]
MNDATCDSIIERLDDLLEGRLSQADRRAVEEHLRSCALCRDLKSLLAEAGAPVSPPASLLGAVLARTSGSTCGSARARLCDHVDRLLGPTDDEMVRMHLDGCDDCGRLAAALARLATDLPSFAELEPDALFVPGVLARTSGRAAPSSVWMARLAAGWRRLAHRPRIAWEGAYAGSLLVLLLFGAPNAPFADVPGRALGLVRTVQATLPADAAAVEAPRIRSAVRSRWDGTKARVQDATRELTTTARRRSKVAWDGLKKEVGTVWDRIASQQTTHDTNEGGSR